MLDEYGMAGAGGDEVVDVVSGPSLLGRDQILAIDDIAYRVVAVPEWGGRVRVKAMQSHERDAFEASLQSGVGRQKKPSLANFRAKLAAKVMVDGEGRPLFGTEDVIRLGQKSAAALARVCKVAMELSGIGDDEVDDMVGNSEGEPSASSS